MTDENVTLKTDTLDRNEIHNTVNQYFSNNIYNKILLMDDAERGRCFQMLKDYADIRLEIYNKRKIH